MNTTELIEIARELGAHHYLDTFEKECICFVTEELQQFAQRIEQPHKQRIVELEQQVKELEENIDIERDEIQSLESDIQNHENDEAKLNEQIAQLREALREVSFIAKTFVDGYEDLSNMPTLFEAEKTSIRTARKQINAIDIKMIKESQ